MPPPPRPVLRAAAVCAEKALALRLEPARGLQGVSAGLGHAGWSGIGRVSRAGWAEAPLGKGERDVRLHELADNVKPASVHCLSLAYAAIIPTSGSCRPWS